MTLNAALVSCAVLGLQHGIDVDHVAAIADITSIQRTPLQAIRSGLLYAGGHAAMVGLLGVAVIMLQRSVPAAVSMGMQRVVGLTLIFLGAYVFISLFSGSTPVGRGQALLSLV